MPTTIEISPGDLQRLSEFASSTASTLAGVEKLLDRQQAWIEELRRDLARVDTEQKLASQSIQSFPRHSASIEQLSRSVVLIEQRLDGMQRSLDGQKSWMAMLSSGLIIGLVTALAGWVIPNIGWQNPKKSTIEMPYRFTSNATTFDTGKNP